MFLLLANPCSFNNTLSLLHSPPQHPVSSTTSLTPLPRVDRDRVWYELKRRRNCSSRRTRILRVEIFKLRDQQTKKTWELGKLKNLSLERETLWEIRIRERETLWEIRIRERETLCIRVEAAGNSGSSRGQPFSCNCYRHYGVINQPNRLLN